MALVLCSLWCGSAQVVLARKAALVMIAMFNSRSVERGWSASLPSPRALIGLADVHHGHAGLQVYDVQSASVCDCRTPDCAVRLQITLLPPFVRQLCLIASFMRPHVVSNRAGHIARD